MRFKNKPYPRDGDMRHIKRFLLFPLRIGNETRWLESVVIFQKYYSLDHGYSHWSNEMFSDPKFLADNNDLTKRLRRLVDE